jgi:hypothetical protein
VLKAAPKSFDFGGLGRRRELIWQLVHSEPWREDDFMAWRARSGR